MSVPFWVQDAVFYQIFPDRFANGEPGNDPVNVQTWGTAPTNWNFMGGDLRGIIQNLDYLLDLGINAIYLNPIFQAASNHRYDTFDYFTIDPKLGDMADFRAFVEVAHRNQVRIILDGVFNHCGRGFFAFHDLIENQQYSPYREWFHVRNFPVDAYTPGESRDYAAWWGMKSLPKLNTGNPAVRKYLFKIARHWIDAGVDGWRLDVPNEIDDDAFWAEFRQVVKSANPEAYLLGEIWNVDARWVGDSHFDGLMNYPMRDCLLRLLYAGTMDTSQCAARMEALLNVYPRQNTYAMYNTLGSHDTERLLTKLEDDVVKTKMAYLFLFAYPGAPAIYYGDEIGLKGGKDPECRGAFPWDRSQWNTDLHSWVKQLISLRKRLSVLRRGDFQTVLTDNRKRCFAFLRRLGDETILMVMNAGGTRRILHIPVAGSGWEDGRIVRNLLGREESTISGDTLTITLPPWSGAWLH
jgi:cyclomaltodextrinase